MTPNRDLDVASTYLFRMGEPLPVDADLPLVQLAVLFFFAKFDVDIRTGRARLLKGATR